MAQQLDLLSETETELKMARQLVHQSDQLKSWERQTEIQKACLMVC